MTQLADLLARARRIQPDRRLDLVFLTIGANDIGFPGLVADIIIDTPNERRIFRGAGIIGSVEASQAKLAGKLPGDFARLRAALAPLIDNAFERVVYVSYGNPALVGGSPCPGGRAGFDINPTFRIGGDRLARISAFVQQAFLPALKDIATCQANGACASASESMTFVDMHQAAFAEHGFCARADSDPPFDRECFDADGKSFEESPVDGATQPLVCGAAVSEFRAYAPRARWIRTANDSYFAAMTFPEGISSTIQPSNLHELDLGHPLGGLWRRHPSDRRRPRRDGRRRARRRAARVAPRAARRRRAAATAAAVSRSPDERSDIRDFRCSRMSLRSSGLRATFRTTHASGSIVNSSCGCETPRSA